MSAARRSLVTLFGAVLLLPALYGFGLPVPLDLAATHTGWAPAASATIHPGVQVVTNGAQCTSNFVFTRGSEVLLGMAAHCAGLGGQTDTNGCTTGSLPTGTSVQISGASRNGTLVYSSWLAMQEAGTTNANACAFNDFALVSIHSDDHGKVNPSMPSWGGPVAVGDGTSAGEQVFSYGNSSLRLGLTLLSPKTGVSLGTSGGGWTHTVYTVTPGIPGDSGSGMLDSGGRAVGVLSTVALAPLALSNGFSDLGSALAFAQSNGMSGVTLAPGTEAFNGSLLGLIG